jgi:hypothetical protein
LHHLEVRKALIKSKIYLFSKPSWAGSPRRSYMEVLVRF